MDGADCRYDLTGCAWCGNGRRDFGESCDCGNDPESLPRYCMDVNGGAHPNCTTDCTKIPFRGDGVIDVDEDCDCGVNPDDLPTWCMDVNGGSDGDCEADGSSIYGPTPDPWGECNSLTIGDCGSPDAWDVDLECSTLPTQQDRCVRSCDIDLDCYWSSGCSPVDDAEIRLPNPCVDGTAIPELRAPCIGPTGVTGWCLPFHPGDLELEPPGSPARPTEAACRTTPSTPRARGSRGSPSAWAPPRMWPAPW